MADETPLKKLYRVELKVGSGTAETVMPLYSEHLEADQVCAGHLVFTPEVPFQYRHPEGVFIAQKMSVHGRDIAGWQEGVLIPHVADTPQQEEVHQEQCAVQGKKTKKGRGSKALSGL